MRLRIGFLLCVALVLAACNGALPTPTATIAPPTTVAATQPPATETSTSTPAPQDTPPTAAAPGKPATLSPATRPATAAAPTRALPSTSEPTTPESPTPSLPPLPFPLPATPTIGLGKLPPPAAAPTATPPAEWATYQNDTYGFSFRYPDERWTVIEQLDEPHGLALVYHELAIALRMRFARPDENAELQLYGGAAGDFVPGGTVRFLGEEIERDALVYRGVASRIFYNNTEPIPRGDMLFSFALVSNRHELSAVLPEEVQAEADGIIESFVMGSQAP